MQFINKLLQLLQQGIAAIFDFVRLIVQWTFDQVSKVDWYHLRDLNLIQLIILIAAGAAVVYLLYKAARELLEAGEKLLSAFVSVLSVFVKVLPYVLIAGIVAAVGAWAITHLKGVI